MFPALAAAGGSGGGMAGMGGMMGMGGGGGGGMMGGMQGMANTPLFLAAGLMQGEQERKAEDKANKLAGLSYGVSPWLGVDNAQFFVNKVKKAAPWAHLTQALANGQQMDQNQSKHNAEMGKLSAETQQIQANTPAAGAASPATIWDGVDYQVPSNFSWG